jgi:hypothetical protein
MTGPAIGPMTQVAYLRGRWAPRPVPVDVLLVRLGDVIRRAG